MVACSRFDLFILRTVEDTLWVQINTDVETHSHSSLMRLAERWGRDRARVGFARHRRDPSTWSRRVPATTPCYRLKLCCCYVSDFIFHFLSDLGRYSSLLYSHKNLHTISYNTSSSHPTVQATVLQRSSRHYRDVILGPRVAIGMSHGHAHTIYEQLTSTPSHAIRASRTPDTTPHDATRLSPTLLVTTWPDRHNSDRHRAG